MMTHVPDGKILYAVACRNCMQTYGQILAPGEPRPFCCGACGCKSIKVYVREDRSQWLDGE